LILNIVGRHYEVSDELKDYVRKKSQKLNKYSSKIVELRVIIESNKHLFNVEAVVLARHLNLYGESKTSDPHSSVDGAIDKVERQLARVKEKMKDKHKAMKSKSAELERSEPESEVTEEEEEEIEE